MRPPFGSATLAPIEMADRPTNWTGVLFGLAIAVVAAFQQFKLPPALPLMIDRYGYDRVLAGGFMSVFALAGWCCHGTSVDGCSATVPCHTCWVRSR